MASLNPPVCDFGWKAPDFKLPAVNHRGAESNLVSRDMIMGKNGLLVMFICNHCPYVKTIKTRLVVACLELERYGINSIAIQSNDTLKYPEDNFARMEEEAKRHCFSFPYVLDETQAVAKAYGAVCTPDFFGFNAKGELQYRGRFDAAGRSPEPPADHTRDLFDAMKLIAKTGEGPVEQIASIGCSIKWKE